MPAATVLKTDHVQRLLRALGYYDGEIDSDPHGDNFRDDLRRFQIDYRLVDDGWYGLQTERVLLPVYNQLHAAPIPTSAQMRRWQLTYYYVGDAAAWTGTTVPMRVDQGPAVNVAAGAFVEAALNGSTKLADGRLINVKDWVAVNGEDYKPVLNIAKRNGWIPEKAGYAGIQLAAGAVANARTFRTVSGGPKGWPVCAKGIECDPFRTLAADNGMLGKHDPKFKGKGGVVPAGTRVFILEMMGAKLPDGTVHDGWFTVNDTGGGIFGAHFDVFTGSKKLADKVSIPRRAHIWFEGIESRLPMNYAYGL